MKPQRVLALVHKHLVPPEDMTGIDLVSAEWKTEYDVISTLRERATRCCHSGSRTSSTRFG